MNESGLDSSPKITSELVRADMQRFMASSYGRPEYGSGIRENHRESIPFVVGEIMSTENADPRTLLKMCSYLADLGEQFIMLGYLEGRDDGEPVNSYGFNTPNLRRKVFQSLQSTLYGPEGQNLEPMVTLLSMFRHFRHREHGGMIKTKFPQRLRYGKDETEMLRRKMPPVQALNYMRTVIAAELRDLEKPQRR